MPLNKETEAKPFLRITQLGLETNVSAHLTCISFIHVSFEQYYGFELAGKNELNIK